MKQPTTKTRVSTRGHTGKAETAEYFSFGSGRSYASAAEYAKEGFPFDILAIEYEPCRGYEGHDRWAITVTAADRDRAILTLGSNPGRDEQLRAAQAHLARGGTIKNVRLRRSGNAYYFTDGDR